MATSSKITITPEDAKPSNAFRTAGGKGDLSATIARTCKPDEFFTAAQQRRLMELLDLRRQAMSLGKELLPAQNAELDELVARELDGSARRAAKTADELGL